MNKIPLVLSGVGILVVILLVASYAFDKSNTPEENKRIEVEAFEHKDVSECDKIKGSSLTYAPAGAEFTISESAAKHTCRENIKNNTKPEPTTR